MLYGRTDYLPQNLISRICTSTAHTSYLKIAEGCNKRCTYCIIPYLRGNYRSIPIEELVAEASLLAKRGTKELIVIAQETTLYGVDLYGEKRLPDLLRELCRIEGLEWIRVMYCYPEEITKELLLTMKQEPKICHYLDLPIQHCNDEVLRHMGRRTTKQELIQKLQEIREILPDIALRTTLISGFRERRKNSMRNVSILRRHIGLNGLVFFRILRKREHRLLQCPIYRRNKFGSNGQMRLWRRSRRLFFGKTKR